MSVNYNKTPFPYFGGKADAAGHVWSALGDVEHYVEPFMGSLAVLLRRPHPCNRTYYSETVNDLDGQLANAWRALRLYSDATAEYASWPVSECDLHARHLWLLKWEQEGNIERLMADPGWCDPKAAGYWMWGLSCWIGSGWCSGQGPWVVGADGRITKREGKEPGVNRQLPHLGDNGRGINHAGCREPGVSRVIPHLGNDGRGVNRPQLREPGVNRKLPHLGNDGTGVNRPQLREPGVSGTPDTPWCDESFHAMTMPELKAWFAFLSARLRHVRILCGDWKRACTNGAAKTIRVRQGDGKAGIFLDPPYSAEAGRNNGLYTQESLTVAHDVRRWCLEKGNDPDLRIVLAGFAGEGHEELTDNGWREVEWFKKGFLKGGMKSQGKDGHQQARERLWLSPHCLNESAGQKTLGL